MGRYGADGSSSPPSDTHLGHSSTLLTCGDRPGRSRARSPPRLLAPCHPGCMTDGEPRAYRPRDVANGFVLGADGTWMPVAPAPPAAENGSAALTALVAGVTGLVVS